MISNIIMLTIFSHIVKHKNTEFLYNRANNLGGVKTTHNNLLILDRYVHLENYLVFIQASIWLKISNSGMLKLYK